MIKIYTTAWCPYCRRAKEFLDGKGIEYEEVDLGVVNYSRAKLAKITGGTTVPQIVINDKCIGGYDDMMTLEASGKLNLK